MFPPKVQRGIELALDANRRGYLEPARLQAVLTYYDRDGATDPPEPELVLQRVGGLTTAQLTDLLGIAAEPLEGTPFTERLSLLEPLGEGAMGAVYRAHDRVLKRTVAVKVIKPDRLDTANAGRLLARFEREAQAMARVRHPACVPIFDAGVEKQSGRPYIVMGLVAGKSLRQLIAEGDGRPLDWRRVAAWGRDLALGLQACHDVGVVHRDVKPANVLVDAGDRPFLTDFGVALDDQARTKLTAEQAAVGTLAYMAPEQATGHPVDARVDVYALGATLYEAATGRAPFEATHALLLIRQIVEADPEPLKKLAPDAPADLDAVLQQALAKHRDDRYATAQALALDLARVLAGEPVLARRTAQDQLARWLARRRRPLALGATLAAGLTAATLLGLQARARQLRAEVLGAVEAAATTSDLDAAARELTRHERVADAELGRAVRAAQDDLATRRALASGSAQLAVARRARSRVLELEEERLQLRTLLAEAPLSASSEQLQRLRGMGVALRDASRTLTSSLDAALNATSREGATREPDRLALLAEVLALRLEVEKDPAVAGDLKEQLRHTAPDHMAVAPVAVTIEASPTAYCQVLRLDYDPASGLMLERLAASGSTPLAARLPPDDYVLTWEANGRLPTRRCLRVAPATPRRVSVALVDSSSLGALVLLDVVPAPGGQCRRGEELQPHEVVEDLLVQRHETDLDRWRSFALATSIPTSSWPPYPRRLPAGSVRYRDAVAYSEWCTALLRETRSPWKARLPRLPELHWLVRGEFEWTFPWGPLLEPGFFANSSTITGGLPSIDAFPDDRSWARVHALAGSCYEWIESDPTSPDLRAFGASVAMSPAQAPSALYGWGTYAQDLAYDTNTVRLVFEPCPLPEVKPDLAAARRHTEAAQRLQAEEKLFEAQREWDQAIAANPLDADLWVARGGCKNLRGDLWGAWWDLSRALALGTADDSVVRFNRAFVQLQRGLPSEAAEDVTKALQAKPDWPEGLILLGRVRAAQGAFDAARDALRSALRLDPSTEPRVRKRLAEVEAAEQAQPR